MNKLNPEGNFLVVEPNMVLNHTHNTWSKICLLFILV